MTARPGSRGVSRPSPYVRVSKSVAGAKGRESMQYHLTIPKHLGEVVPEGQLFEASLTDEGILYRAVAKAATPSVPKWAS